MTPQTGTATQTAKTAAIAKPTETENSLERFQQAFESIEKRAFEIFDNNGRWIGHDLSDWFQAESELFHPVHLEIADSQDALTVRAEVPGFTAKELDIRVEGNRLTISGKHESREENKKGKTIYSERCAKEILRTVVLPSDVDGSKVNATLKDGVLQMELPKSASSKNVRIEPKSLS